MDKKIKEVVAVVTGGSSGVGKSIAKRIINNNGKVIVIDINEEKGETLAKTLGNNFMFIKADVTSEKEIKEALDKIKQEKIFSGINVLINCAGIVEWGVPYDFDGNTPLPLENYKRVMDVNALGTFNITRLVINVMIENLPDANEQRGVIINIGSVMATDGREDLFAYCVSKAAVVGMTLPLARAVANKGLRVVTLSPGYIDTPMARTMGPIEKINQAMLELNLFPKRIGQPEEIAHVVQCIIENPFINAVNITVSGGYHYVK